uniref:Uncharacterized protein n=1 Tax=uncultured Armatimonadetes bacterium TaxID=157466 RepID=A0A6J4H247_9BACT|nr:hypothetical protein AVDCRST_MAG63-1557 [uncultured Armatimonadetes bacterium]
MWAWDGFVEAAARRARKREREALYERLSDAIIGGDRDAVVAFLDAGAEPGGAKAENGMTMLMYAAYGGRAEAARLLLGRGADPNAATASGLTALMYAQQSFDGHPDAVRVLLEHGADPNAATDDGWTALMMAATSDSHLEAARALLDGGAGVNRRDSCDARRLTSGMTALMWAASLGCGRTVALLVERGADVDLVDGEGLTALDMALRGLGNPRENIINVLRRGGAV